MSKISKIVLSSIGALLILFGVFYLNNVGEDKVMGSINGSGDAYNSTTTSEVGWVALAPRLLKTGQGILGSVVITNSTATTIKLYNATTSDVNKRTGNVASTTLLLGQFGASVAAGTYTFDTAFTDGLLLDLGGSLIASTTITWK